MAQPARNVRMTRRSWLLAGLGIPLLRARGEEPLLVSFDGDNIRVSAPGLHFLTGKPLERLKAADTVVFDSQITLFTDDRGTIFHRPVTERLIFSYDLWEEKFKVTVPRMGFGARAPIFASPPGRPKPSPWANWRLPPWEWRPTGHSG